MKLLVLGGYGYLGNKIILQALEKNWKVVSVSKKRNSRQLEHKNLKNLFFDMTNLKKLKSLSRYHFDYVVNVSGYVDHSLFCKNGIEIANNHLIMVLNLISILSRKKLKKFMQIGSSEEYGVESSSLIETNRELPFTPYAASKVALTHFLQMLSKTEEFPSVIIRLFLTYGPGQNNRRFIPQVITGCLKGDNFSASLGEQKRDFLYIDDTVEAIFRLLNTNDIDGQIFNIASGNPIRIRDIVKKIKILVNNGTPNYGAIPYRKEENMLLYADISKLKKVINWSPKISLEDGLIKTISWYKNFI